MQNQPVSQLAVALPQLKEQKQAGRAARSRSILTTTHFPDHILPAPLRRDPSWGTPSRQSVARSSRFHVLLPSRRALLLCFPTCLVSFCNPLPSSEPCY